MYFLSGFQAVRAVIALQATYFLAWPVLGSGIILLAQPQQNPEVPAHHVSQNML